MADAIAIARATPADFLAIADLDAKAWGEGGLRIADGEHTWRLWCEHAVVWVATRQPTGGIVGVLLCFPGSGEVDLLHKVFVDADCRGRGVGTQLVEAFTRHATRPTILTVDPANARAWSVYERLGFQRDTLVRGFYRPGEDRYVMRWSPPTPATP